MTQQRVLHHFYLVAAVVLAASCSSTRLKVESNPVGAAVKIRLPDQSVKTLGNTPLEVSSDELSELGNEILELSVDKDGYNGFSTYLPPTRSSFDAKISVNLKEALGSDSKNVESLCAEAAESTAQIMQSINRKDFVEAQRIVSSQMVRFPRASVFLDLQGNIFYLQKRTGDAIAAYKASLKINPQNQRTRKILDKLVTLHTDNSNPTEKNFSGGQQ